MAKASKGASDLLKALKAKTKTNIVAISLEEHFADVLPYFSTDIPAMDLLFSGSLLKGMESGITALAGPSKHFKSTFGILLASRFLRTFEDGVVLFYDSEGGTPRAYWTGFGADTDRVLYCPITTIEEFASDVLQRLERVEEGQKVFIFIDSLGNAPSNKEVDDALKGESKVDMTRAKAAKAFWRQITGPLKRKKLWCVPIHHTYKTLEIYSKDVVSGGCVVWDTPVQMADGTLKMIQDIQVGELVATPVGPRPVTHTWNPETLEEGEPECYEIEFDDGEVVTISYNDHFLINGEFVTIDKVNVGDDVSAIF